MLSVGNEAGFIYLLNYSNASNAYNLKYIHKFKPHGKAIKVVQFLAENTILTASDDGMIKLYDINKNEIIRTFTGHKFGITGLDINPSNQNVL
jgi:WD40 repeat protein